MRKYILLILSIFLLSILLTIPSTAQPLEVQVVEETSRISIIVNQNGEPVSGAVVRISGLGEETALDGEYITNENGKVIFNKDLSGVTNLRIEVESGRNFISTVTTIVRGPDIQKAPLGQQMWNELRQSSKRTEGVIIGSLTTKNSSIERLSRKAQSLLVDIIDKNVQKERLGREYVTRQITIDEYYFSTINNEVRREKIRYNLLMILEELRKYPESILKKSEINTEAINQHYNDILEGKNLETTRRIRNLSQSL